MSMSEIRDFQDHPFPSEFVEAHDLAFIMAAWEIVYDQDRVMTVSENAGDLILTERKLQSMPFFSPSLPRF